jgi:hypothetical protein
MNLKLQEDIIDSSCVFSEDRVYRYSLLRVWNKLDLKRIIFIGLNPSTAEEKFDDNTVRKCINVAKREGFTSMCMLNVFAYRATNPKELEETDFPKGINNDYNIWFNCQNPKTQAIVLAWGNHAKFHNRHFHVLNLVRGISLLKTNIHVLLCFDKNKNGYPKHPLYCKNNTQLKEYCKF